MFQGHVVLLHAVLFNSVYCILIPPCGFVNGWEEGWRLLYSHKVSSNAYLDAGAPAAFICTQVIRTWLLKIIALMPPPSGREGILELPY